MEPLAVDKDKAMLDQPTPPKIPCGMLEVLQSPMDPIISIKEVMIGAPVDPLDPGVMLLLAILEGIMIL